MEHAFRIFSSLEEEEKVQKGRNRYTVRTSYIQGKNSSRQKME